MSKEIADVFESVDKQRLSVFEASQQFSGGVKANVPNFGEKGGVVGGPELVNGCPNFSGSDLIKETPKPEKEPRPFSDIGREIGELVEEKNKAYGSSFDKCGTFLKLLYPDGVEPEQYTDMLCIVRMFDKLIRIATNKDAFGESPYRDLVGYGLLGVRKDETGG